MGRHVYGLGAMVLGAIGLASGDFLSGQPVPKTFPDRTALAYAVGAFILAAGLGIQFRRTLVWAAAALTAYYFFFVVVLMDGRLWLAHYDLYLVYENLAEQLAIAAGGLIVFAAHADLDAALTRRLTRLGQIAFGFCAVIFGGAHFAYMNLTAPLIPKYLPPSQLFWGYATGVAQIAAGLAILSGVQAPLAARLLTAMYAIFILLIWTPMLAADHTSIANWNEAAATLILIGAAWVVAESFTPAPSAGRPQASG